MIKGTPKRSTSNIAGSEAREAVVLIHGLGAHWALMQPLAWRLKRAGFATMNWGYRSFTRDIETHAEALAEWLTKLDNSGTCDRFHLVAHSLGSILIRCMLLKHQFVHLGRIVMLTPPNRGSHMATFVTPYLPASLRTLHQITDRDDSFVNQLPQTLPVETGIIAAKGDRVVNGLATQLDGATDFVQVPGMHNAVLFRPRVAELCIRFLRTGKFLTV